MAIEEFGESLLSNVREQNERLARKERKREEKYATYGLGLNLANTIGNQILAEKTQDFLSNEKIISARTNQNKAITFANTFIQEQNAIGNQDIGVYFYNKLKPQVEAELQITTTPGQRANISKYNALADQTTKERAKKASAAHLQGYELATRIAKEEDFENVIAMNSKAVRPTTMQGWLTGSLRRAFSNKTKEQLDNEAFQAILEGPAAKDTEAILKFKKAYIQTNSLDDAVTISPSVLPSVSTDISEDMLKAETLPGGETFYSVWTETRHLDGTKTIVRKDNQDQNAGRIEKIFLSQIKRDLNLFDITNKGLSEEAQSKFYTRLKEAGIPITGIYSSTENVNKAADIFQNLLANKSNYEDKQKADLYKEVISAILPELVNLKAVMAATDEKGNLTEDGSKMIANSVIILNDILARVYDTDDSSNETDDSSNETGNESNNFDITWPESESS